MPSYVDTGKSDGNRLERDVYAKLKKNKELAHIKVDGLMFYHVYSDLMALAKSNTLNKSALDTTYHYLDLLTFLCTISGYYFGRSVSSVPFGKNHIKQ